MPRFYFIFLLALDAVFIDRIIPMLIIDNTPMAIMTSTMEIPCCDLINFTVSPQLVRYTKF